MTFGDRNVRHYGDEFQITSVNSSAPLYVMSGDE
jgi:hypothetical protein